MLTLSSALISIVISIYFSGKRQIEPNEVGVRFANLPLIIISILAISGYTLIDYVEWIIQYTAFFIIAVFLLAVSSAIAGVIEGIYTFNSEAMLYAAFSNVTGGLCSLAFLSYIKTLPHFSEFLRNTIWIDYASFITPAMIFPCYLQVLANQNIDKERYSLKKWHTRLNALHLWFTLTMIGIQGFLFYTYAISNHHLYKINIQVMLPILAVTLFFWYAACTPCAIKQNAVNVTASIIGLIFLTIAEILAISLFKFSSTTVVVIICCTIIWGIWWRLIRWLKSNPDIPKAETSKWVLWLLILFVCAATVAVIFQLINTKLETVKIF